MRYASSGQFTDRNIDQFHNEGVGPEEVAWLKKLHDDGLLAAHCDRVLLQILVPALAQRLVDMRHKSST